MAKLKIAFQMDPMEGVDINADTTFALAETAMAIGAELFEYHPDHLRYEAGKVLASARPMTVRRIQGDHVSFEGRRDIDLAADVDVVLMRQDPPFDMAYLTAAHLLELIGDQTLVLNDPASVRSSPEKLFPLEFPNIIPKTLITRDIEAIKAFRKKHQDIIVKPLFGNGGAGIFRIKQDDSNLSSLLELFLESSREALIIQEFLPAVKNGDKRIILIDGEPVGAINRVPQKGETRSNLHVGGSAEPTDLNDTDKQICAALTPELKRRGMMLVGIDVIGDKLTEINVTSPTGIQEMKRFTGVDAASLFWKATIKKLQERS